MLTRTVEMPFVSTEAQVVTDAVAVAVEPDAPLLDEPVVLPVVLL
ncbi:hypothetical protein SXANM310S_06695 [Streptomyces xanthochromogenes]|uniref:Uncharacterized protein n=1 Tax=Streptomyces xanthochromogenes TaxID=67384 RepID=A0ABQ2ZYR9_9ACTN|nr:hypothetical protein GCM10010326_23660 [Streptomyces xanthochromogenes]